MATAAMWVGQQWGGHVLAGTVSLLLAFDLRQDVIFSSRGQCAARRRRRGHAGGVVLLLGGGSPGQPFLAPPTADGRCPVVQVGLRFGVF